MYNSCALLSTFAVLSQNRVASKKCIKLYNVTFFKGSVYTELGLSNLS